MGTTVEPIPAARRLAAALALVLAACGGGTEQADEAPEPRAGRTILVFTRTEGFRHDSIPAAVAAVEAELTVEVTDDPAAFTDERLGGVDAVVFLLTTGDVLDPPQEQAFERFVRAGGGYAGVHSASDTEYDWPFYGEVVGAYFARHPDPTPATVHVEDPTHASTRHLPAEWRRSDEWYDFRANPRPGVHVLATVDESTYEGGGMGADHPVAWCHAVGDGRAFYTAGGHGADAWADPTFVAHVTGGIRYAAGLDPACGG